MLNKTVVELLKKRSFINIATCNKTNQPNSISKLILKAEDRFVYLVDYTIGRTYQNLKINPYASLSFFDTDGLKGYQINGPVEVIEEGSLYEKLSAEITAKEISLSTERIIKGVSSGQRHEHFELVAPKKFAIFKVKMEEMLVASYSGEIKREKF